MAMAVTCLEQIFEIHNQCKAESQVLIECFWDFVESENLADWDDRRCDIPVLEAISNLFDFKEPVPDQFCIQQAPLWILEAVYWTESLGTDELYGAVESYSPRTLDALTRVLTFTLDNGFHLPDLEHFTWSHFHERSGWGHHVPRTRFQKQTS